MSNYTAADHQFDAEHAHGWKPAKWTVRHYCDCGHEFDVVMTRGSDKRDDRCPACGSDSCSS